MNKPILTICILLVTASIMAQEPMPETMADSIFQVRQGVLDFGEVTVGQMFLDKTFISTTNLDGTVSTCRYGESSLVKNSYVLIIELVSDDVVEGRLFYFLQLQGDMTILNKVTLEDTLQGQSMDGTSFDDKLYMMNIFFQAIE